MSKELPMKRAYLYTENITVRVEPELKQTLRDLNMQGIDVPELLRSAIRSATKRLETQDKAS